MNSRERVISIIQAIDPQSEVDFNEFDNSALSAIANVTKEIVGQLFQAALLGNDDSTMNIALERMYILDRFTIDPDTQIAEEEIVDGVKSLDFLKSITI